MKQQGSLLKGCDQLRRMCAEMPDAVLLILNGAVNKKEKEKVYDFTYLDPPFINFQQRDRAPLACHSSLTDGLRKQHPLYTLAESGNERLLRHEAVGELLQFKWRWLPRLIYYVNLLLYFVFVVLLTYQIIIGQNSLSTKHRIRSLEIAHNTSAIEIQLLKFR